MNLGWIRQKEDLRDFRSVVHQDIIGATPMKYSISTPFVYDQGQIGSCVANSSCLVFINSLNKIRPQNNFLPSRLFVYYNARKMEGCESQDSGCIIRDAFKSINKEGLSQEKYCKYNETRFAKKPSLVAYSSGRKHQSITYASVDQNIDVIKKTIFAGYLVSFGTNVYRSIMEAYWFSSGIMPTTNLGQSIGGHAITIVGWDDSIKCFEIQNSWGSNWCKNGKFFIPYEWIISQECSDFWTITKTEV